ncbi:hypothetical protein B0H63DRAFT_504839 [Podospora didyma]|uniref:Retrovirus-related Pol polyprotein from transposon TNT 1-94-like beta-barrel domain-containing protein n=1 Tax=Podospora didyma TaxID=330526 RepID=A0AAE0P3M3_9PEZI|nr:hypothetical protein B0H63DRAFT_504839 [Podospora didyma]
MPSATATSGLCPDWIISNNSDVHVAKDRDWFVDYEPFQTFATGLGQGKMEVVGVGSVEIPVETSGQQSSCSDGGGGNKLRLHNVLHIPSMLCNILGGPVTGDYDSFQIRGPGFTSDQEAGAITSSDNQRVATLAKLPCHLFGLKLSGPPAGGHVLGPTSLKADGGYLIHAFWSDAERRKWAEAQQASNAGRRASEPQGSSSSSSLPYTDEEKDWIKQNFGDEYHFLLIHGLSIHKEEDREDGRTIARTLMDSDSADEDEDMEDEESEDDAVHGNAATVDGILAGVGFTAEEVAFMRVGWGSTENFLASFGFKFYKEGDLEEAKGLVQALMAPDTDDEDEGSE